MTSLSVLSMKWIKISLKLIKQTCKIGIIISMIDYRRYAWMFKSFDYDFPPMNLTRPKLRFSGSGSGGFVGTFLPQNSHFFHTFHFHIVYDLWLGFVLAENEYTLAGFQRGHTMSNLWFLNVPSLNRKKPCSFHTRYLMKDSSFIWLVCHRGNMTFCLQPFSPPQKTHQILKTK